jgi:hypothetical protein
VNFVPAMWTDFASERSESRSKGIRDRVRRGSYLIATEIGRSSEQSTVLLSILIRFYRGPQLRTCTHIMRTDFSPPKNTVHNPILYSVLSADPIIVFPDP